MVDLSLSEGELDARIENIASFVRDQCALAGVEGVVLGVSGGLDSATTAALASRAVGPERVKALVLPADPTSQTSLELAEATADAFDLDLERIDVEPIVETVLAAYDRPVGQSVIGNVRARSRAIVWYTAANEENRLVLGGGNRSEWLTGYFTKYGDIAVDCLPLGNLYKGQVRQLAARLGVPQAIIDRPPTAELWRGQTDEDELGVSYEVLDGILALHIDGEQNSDETAEILDVDVSVVDRVVSLVEASAHKRTIPPTP